jgi:dihydrolipoamide dehydrogenase
MVMADIPRTTELAVVGAGPGGYAAAFLAADLGMQVCLIDPNPHPGGVCLYQGCIPSKALLHVAKVLHEARQAQQWGVTFGTPSIDLEKLVGWKNQVIEQLTTGLAQLCKRRNVSYIQGTAQFKDPTTLQLHTVQGDETNLTVKHTILATGSRALNPASFPPLTDRIMDAKAALELSQIPSSLLVIGGGYIGLELGSVYAALGTEVTVVEATAGLLPAVDRDLVRVLSRRLEQEFKSILLSSQVTAIEQRSEGIVATVQQAQQAERELLVDQVLVAVGRVPNSHDLGLVTTRVQCDQRGFVKVDGQRRTDEPTIYAIGDLTGEPMLAHKAAHEARIAVEAIAGQSAFFEPFAIPAVVFTDPEIAWCGLTESDARQNGDTLQVVRFPWGASGRALTLGQTDGLTKMIVDRQTERIMGVGIVGSGAGELIAEGAHAIEMAARVSDLKMTIHPHPTLSETLMECAEVFFGQSTHLYRPVRAKPKAR